MSFILMSTKCQKIPIAKICRDSSSQKKALRCIIILVLIFDFDFIIEISTIFSHVQFQKVVIFRTRFLSLDHCVRRCVFVFWPTRPHEKKMSGINISYLLIKSVRWNEIDSYKKWREIVSDELFKILMCFHGIFL